MTLIRLCEDARSIVIATDIISRVRESQTLFPGAHHDMRSIVTKNHPLKFTASKQQNYSSYQHVTIIHRTK